MYYYVYSIAELLSENVVNEIAALMMDDVTMHATRIASHMKCNVLV